MEKGKGPLRERERRRLAATDEWETGVQTGKDLSLTSLPSLQHQDESGTSLAALPRPVPYLIRTEGDPHGNTSRTWAHLRQRGDPDNTNRHGEKGG